MSERERLLAELKETRRKYSEAVALLIDAGVVDDHPTNSDPHLDWELVREKLLELWDEE